MRILLDTSAYSAFMRGHEEVRRTLQEADEIFFNPVVLGELRAGFMKGNSRGKNEKILRSFFDSPRVGVVKIDEETSEHYAAILGALWSAGTPIPTNDIWIAASAMQHGLRVLTTDAHYQRVQQVIVDYFSA